MLPARLPSDRPVPLPGMHSPVVLNAYAYSSREQAAAARDDVARSHLPSFAGRVDTAAWSAVAATCERCKATRRTTDTYLVQHDDVELPRGRRCATVAVRRWRSPTPEPPHPATLDPRPVCGSFTCEQGRLVEQRTYHESCAARSSRPDLYSHQLAP